MRPSNRSLVTGHFDWPIEFPLPTRVGEREALAAPSCLRPIREKIAVAEAHGARPVALGR